MVQVEGTPSANSEYRIYDGKKKNQKKKIKAYRGIYNEKQQTLASPCSPTAQRQPSYFLKLFVFNSVGYFQVSNLYAQITTP